MADSTDMKNLGQFGKLIEFVEEDKSWNPANADLKLGNLKNLYDECLALLKDLPVKQTPYTSAVNEREIAYEQIFPEKITRSKRIYKSNNPSAQAYADVETFARKATGKRKKTKAVDDPNTPEDEAAAAHSVSQQSFESLLGHYRGLIALYSADPAYQTSEPGFTVAELTADADNLEAKNAAVAAAFAPFSSARIARNNRFYLDENCLYQIQGLVKIYAEGHYSRSDERFKRIKSLRFTIPRNLRRKI